MTTLKVGGDVDTFCSRCDLTLAHVIIAMENNRPARVQCKTCKNPHVYRSGEKKVRATSTGTKAPRRTESVTTDYDTAMNGKDLSRAKRYDVKTTFDDGEIVDHKLFGFGLVTRVLGDGKIDVMFKVGAKVLIHGR